MAKGELENRDREELGDLPETLGLERGDLMRYSGRPGRVPVDMRNNAAQRQAAGAAPIGTPQLDFDVRSIYDSRPVQGRDFNQWFGFSTEGGGTIPGTFFNQALVVPTGYVAVVRRIMFRTTAAVWTGPYQNEMNVTKNGAVVMPETLPLNPASQCFPLETIPISNGESIETFIIADEAESVGIVLYDSGGSPDVIDTIQYFVGFYGQFLLKTGVPAAMQVANYAGTKAPPKTVGNPQPSPEARTLRNKDPYKGVPLAGTFRPGMNRGPRGR